MASQSVNFCRKRALLYIVAQEWTPIILVCRCARCNVKVHQPPGLQCYSMICSVNRKESGLSRCMLLVRGMLSVTRAGFKQSNGMNCNSTPRVQIPVSNRAPCLVPGLLTMVAREGWLLEGRVPCLCKAGAYHSVVLVAKGCWLLEREEYHACARPARIILWEGRRKILQCLDRIYSVNR